jgi:hypothetical protein
MPCARTIEAEIEESLNRHNVTIERLVEKLERELEAEKSVWVGKDADEMTVADREHQRWVMEKLMKLRKMLGIDAQVKEETELTAEDRAALVIRVKNLTLNVGDLKGAGEQVQKKEQVIEADRVPG